MVWVPRAARAAASASSLMSTSLFTPDILCTIRISHLPGLEARCERRPPLGFIDALAQGSDYELVNYKITDVEARQDGDILVDGKPVTSQPSPSLVTFVRVGGQWKLASDAFFSK